MAAVGVVVFLDWLAADPRDFMLMVVVVGLGHNAVSAQYSRRRIRVALAHVRIRVWLIALGVLGMGLWMLRIPIGWVFWPHHAASEAWMGSGPRRALMFVFHAALFGALAGGNLDLPALAAGPLSIAAVLCGASAVVLAIRDEPDTAPLERLEQLGEVPLGLMVLANLGPSSLTALHLAAYHYAVWMAYPVYTHLSDRQAVRAYVGWTLGWTGLMLVASPLVGAWTSTAQFISVFVATSMVHILTSVVLSDANPDVVVRNVGTAVARP